MKTKKIILFIVEGISEKTALGLILSKLFEKCRIEFKVVNGDLTSNEFTNLNNCISRVNDQIKGFRGNIYKSSDIIKVVHLVDTDGVYCDNACIENRDVKTWEYYEDRILANNIDYVIDRNMKKQLILNKLSSRPVIAKINYSMYYFSCNFDHVIHNECNLPENLKDKKAEEFSEKYYDGEKKFVDFISNSVFAVSGNYKDSWEFIKTDNNSLKRYTNFHLLFNEFK